MKRLPSLAALLLACAASSPAQVRVTPKESKGGPRYVSEYAEPWVEITTG